MPATMPDSRPARLPLVAQSRPVMAKAALRLPQSDAYRALVGACIDRAAKSLGWSLKELAGHLDRGERQVAAWIAGREHPQLDVLFSVESLRGPLVIALAGLSEQIEIRTTITVRRTA